jgi:rhodanese-related sulfurtransferase
LSERFAARQTTVIDLDLSKRYAQGHIPGAWFAIRARLAAALTKIPASETLVLTSLDGALAKLAAAELQGSAGGPVLALSGGTQAWVAAGLPLETGPTRMADSADDVFLMPRERKDREAAMRDYLTWEINLVNDMAEDDDQRFHVVIG